MKIEAGKFYKTRDGRKVGPMKATPLTGFYAFRDASRGPNYSADGRLFEDRPSDWDIVSEWNDEPRPWGELTDAEKVALVEARRDGKQIEYKPHLRSLDHWDTVASPGWHDDTPYRVKPEPVVETVTLEGFTHNREWFFREKDARKTHRITFNTIDGEPDCSSIKMERINDA